MPHRVRNRWSGGWARRDAPFGAGWSATVLELPAPSRSIPAPAPLSAQERSRLEAIRALGRGSALAAREAPIPACARLWDMSDPAERRSADAQFRAWLETIDRRLTLYRPGASGLSADESWLLRLVDALINRDFDAARALIAFRIRPDRRRAALPMALTIAFCVEHLALSQSRPR